MDFLVRLFHTLFTQLGVLNQPTNGYRELSGSLPRNDKRYRHGMSSHKPALAISESVNHLLIALCPRPKSENWRLAIGIFQPSRKMGELAKPSSEHSRGGGLNTRFKV